MTKRVINDSKSGQIDILKTLLAGMLFALLGIFLPNGSTLCAVAESSEDGASSEVFSIVLPDKSCEIYSIAPLIHYTVPDKLRGKRRGVSKSESVFAPFFAACVLSIALAGLFYAKFFVSASARLCAAPSYLAFVLSGPGAQPGRRIFALLI